SGQVPMEMSEDQANDFSVVEGQKYMSLTTFRKSDKPVPTPVWFVEKNDKLCVWTQLNSGKVKRLRHNSRVTLAPCTMGGKVIGPTVEGIARLVSPQEKEEVRLLLLAKYGWMQRLFSFIHRHDEMTALEIAAR
ncbi:MAG: PPOX class F420-dependent oxidoreductase, partial [Acidobacteriota bacterium]